MQSVVTDTDSPEATERVAAQLGRTLVPGDVVLISGDLGAGKTTFVRGAVRALGFHGAVTSPTFTVAQRYVGDVAVSHLDLYRLGDLADEDPALLEDEVGPERVTFVEWPDVGAAWLTERGRVAARVTLEHLALEQRRVTILTS